MAKQIVKFCVTYMGLKPVATKTIVDYFLPIMRCTHDNHAAILYATYIDGGAPERAKYDLEYVVEYDADKEYWQHAIDWWMEHLNLKVEILPFED